MIEGRTAICKSCSNTGIDIMGDPCGCLLTPEWREYVHKLCQRLAKLPMWKRMPDAYGWWFFTSKLEDWDLAEPISVSRVDRNGLVTFERTDINEKSVVIQPEDGCWFGPIAIEHP